MKISRNQYLISQLHNLEMDFDGKVEFCGLTLYHGEGTKFTILEKEDRAYLLIGYLIDPTRPNLSTEEVLQKKVSSLGNTESIACVIESLGGRWVLLESTEKQIKVYTDACSLKQVYFTLYEQLPTISSDVELLSNIYDYQPSNTRKEYMEEYCSIDNESVLPLSLTSYEEVSRLLPNHSLNLDTGKVERYWPKEDIEFGNYEMLLDEISNSLRGMLKGISNYYRPTLTLTAGFDSRLVLSGALDIIGKFDVVTLKYKHMSINNPDILKARALCNLLGVEHQVLTHKNNGSVYTTCENESMKYYHDYWTDISCMIRENGFQSSHWIKGSCCEIARNSFGVIDNNIIDAKTILKLYNIPISSFTLLEVDRWLLDIKKTVKLTNLKVLDLFYWEHRMGSWQATSQFESDIVHESFTPFNSRSILEAMLTIPLKKRLGPNYPFINDLVTKNSLELAFEKRPLSINEKVKLCIKYRMPIVYKWIINHVKRNRI